MSWIYTVLVAGLLFSPQESPVSYAENIVQDQPVVVETAVRDDSEHFEQVYPLTANGRVCLSNVNGSVIVEAWDRNEVKVEYTKTADAKDRLGDIEVRIDSRPDYLSIEADLGNWKKDKGGWRQNGKLQVEFHLMVPRGASLNEIETVNGSVSVSNFTNLTKVSAVNGGVNAANLRGTASLSTVNGEISAEFDRLEAGSKVNLSTVNGAARILIPSDSNATFKVDSLNGNITNDFNLPVRKGKYVGRDLYGKVGTGDVIVKLSSVNGPLTISRKNDGKSLSPAVNLLPQKKDDDWDDASDEDAMIDSEKLNKDIAKSVKTAQKELVRIQPEIAKVTAEAVKVVQSDELKHAIKDAIRQKAVIAKVVNAGFMTSVPRFEKKSASFPVKGVPKVTVAAEGCAVSVRGWDKNEVQYRVVQFADARNASPLVMTEDHSDSAVNIRVNDPERGGNVRIEVFVPKKSNLKITTNGGIRLEGVSGDVELVGGDESVNVRDVDGKLRVVTTDGRIRVLGFKGEVDAESTDGMINLEGEFQKLTAHTNAGPVILTLPETAAADLEANCPDIKGDGISVSRTSTSDEVSRYRIGAGGPLFRIDAGGEIRVRGKSILVASL